MGRGIDTFGRKHMKPIGIVLFVAACAWAATGAADTLALKDGRTFEGRIVKQTAADVVFEVHGHGGRMKYSMTVPREQVASLTEGKIAAEAPGSAEPKPLAAGEFPPEPEAPPVEPARSPSYCVIPLHGVVGHAFVADVLDKSLLDAEKRGPDVVLLDIDSPGGLIDEVERLAAVLRAHRGKVRVVAYVSKHAISAAAIALLAVEEIHMHPSAVVGAATGLKISPFGVPTELPEKSQSVWRATARSCAEAGGHSPLLAEAMIDPRMELYVVVEDGKPVVRQGRVELVTVEKREGGRRVVRKEGAGDARVVTVAGKLLTMTATEAEQVGLSAGKADDYAALGKALGFEGWTECAGLGRPLAEHRAQVVEKVRSDFARFRQEFRDAMRQAVAADPTRHRYVINPRTGAFTPQSRRQWQERTAVCYRFLGKAERALKQAKKLAERFPRVTLTDVAELRDIESRIKTIRNAVAREAYRKEAG